MKTPKFWYEIKATYRSRKNAKSETSNTVKVRARSVIETINKAREELKLIGKPVAWQVISINGTPMYCKPLI